MTSYIQNKKRNYHIFKLFLFQRHKIEGFAIIYSFVEFYINEQPSLISKINGAYYRIN